jgi:hypothetical protein
MDASGRAPGTTLGASAMSYDDNLRRTVGPRSRSDAPRSISDSVVRPVFTNSPQVAAFHRDKSLSDTSLYLVPHTRALVEPASTAQAQP